MQQTVFHQYHVDHGAKLVEFAGWEMPIMFSSIHDEHNHVRTGAGLFDVSHMGRFKLSGRHARRLLERVLTRRVSTMPENSCRYALVCNDRGGVLDDVIVYRFEDHWLLVVNAANRDKILAHINANVGDWTVKIEDMTESTAMVALQGPKVMAMLADFSREVPTLKRYTFCEKNLFFLNLTISRTGYTGEDGVEVILPKRMANSLIRLLAKESSTEGDQVKPCGLGARDTVRMEAAMPLYGHELDEDTDPISAGLGFAVDLDKDQDERGEPFIGIEALQRIAAEGPLRKLVGLRLDGKRTARQGMAVTLQGNNIGAITSGCVSPTLGYPIAMAYVDVEHAEVGTTVGVALGSKQVDARIVGLPFYECER